MSWLFYAFSGPVLWAMSTHLDKYLVDRYFRTSEVAVLLVFTSLVGIGLSIVFPRFSRERLSAPELARKGLAAVLVALGVILVNR